MEFNGWIFLYRKKILPWKKYENKVRKNIKNGLHFSIPPKINLSQPFLLILMRSYRKRIMSKRADFLTVSESHIVLFFILFLWLNGNVQWGRENLPIILWLNQRRSTIESQIYEFQIFLAATYSTHFYFLISQHPAKSSVHNFPINEIKLK
jgi:hypothetical protein